MTNRSSDDTDPGTSIERRPGNSTTAWVLGVLGAFLDDKGSGYRVSELCVKLQMPKQTVIRALQALCREGYVVKHSDGGYHPGYGLFELGSFDQVEPDLVEIARPTMQRLHELTGETVTLALRTGDSLVLIESIDGRWPITGRMPKGRPMLLNIGPASRAVLACLSDSEIGDFIARHSPLPATTPTAISDPEALWREIRSTRLRGYGEGLSAPGIQVIGFPVLGADHRPHGSIGVIGLEKDMQSPRVRAKLGEICRAVAQLNEETALFHVHPHIEIGL